MRIESVQNAADQANYVAGRLAGVDAGAYDAVPWFWSDQGEIKLRIVGITSGSDSVVVRGERTSQSFTTICFRDGRLVGAESVNAMTDHLCFRRLLAREPDRLSVPSQDELADPEFDLRAHAMSATARG